jgi:hypothetical protein
MKSYGHIDRPKSRGSDPRYWSGRRPRSPRPTVVDFKAPLIALAVVLALLVVYFIAGRPLWMQHIQDVRFDTCQSRLVQLKMAMGKIDHIDLSVGYPDVYVPMKKSSNMHVEQWIGNACLGDANGNWVLTKNLRFTPTGGYIITGASKTNPPCAITVTRDALWPMIIKDCGKPAPPGVFK